MDRIIKNLLVAIFLLLISVEDSFAKDPLRPKHQGLSWSSSYFGKNNIPIPLSTNIGPSLPVWPKELVKLYDTISVSFIGDVMQHGVQIRNALIEGKDASDGNSYNYSSAFKYLRERFEESDITVANMEFTLGTLPYTGYPQFSAPEAIATQAKRSGINLFLLANNHILDKGASGLQKTLDIYDTIGVRYTGAYRDSCTEANTNPMIIEAKGVKIAFINFTYGTNGFRTPEPYIVNRMDSIKVKEAIQRAKERGARMIIALPHWGYEYQLQPNGEQHKWAQMLFKNGVQAIIGSHPHVPQTAEIYLTGSHHPRRYGEVDRMVFYSLGNYISNQSNPDYTQVGMLVTIKIVKNNLSGEVTLSGPEWEYLWCFRKGELEPHYTVVPIEEFINKINSNNFSIAAENEKEAFKIKNSTHYQRMVKTFEYIRSLKAVKMIK